MELSEFQQFYKEELTGFATAFLTVAHVMDDDGRESYQILSSGDAPHTKIGLATILMDFVNGDSYEDTLRDE